MYWYILNQYFSNTWWRGRLLELTWQCCGGPSCKRGWVTWFELRLFFYSSVGFLSLTWRHTKNGTSMFRLRYKGKVAAGSPRGSAGRRTGRWFKQTAQKVEDLRPFQDEAADGRQGSCLACINAHPGVQRGKECFHFFCRGPQSMHEQCNLFKSHSILLFMSRQAEAKKQDYRVSQVIFVETGSEWSTVCRGQ